MIDANELRFAPLSEDCQLVSWPSVIDVRAIKQVKALATHLNSIAGVMECVPAYASLAVYFDGSLFDHSSIEKLIVDQLEQIEIKEEQANTWEIPVCYHPSLGLDQKRFANERKIDSEELVTLHANTSYTVLMRGFQPGFLYMGEINERLHLPRLKKPRPQVSAGSVGIADAQTGVYPLQSPGGWNIIGQTPAPMLDFSSPEIEQGDQVRFTAISLDAYHQMKQKQSGPSKD